MTSIARATKIQCPLCQELSGTADFQVYRGPPGDPFLEIAEEPLDPVEWDCDCRARLEALFAPSFRQRLTYLGHSYSPAAFTLMFYDRKARASITADNFDFNLLY